jgi:hypothetical protein
VYFYILRPKPLRDDDIHALTMNTRATNVLLSGVDSLPYGGYQKLETPSWARILLLMSIIGTSATILLYGRVFLPIGDLAEGGNVLKAIRNEFKPIHQQQSGHGSGVSRRERRLLSNHLESNFTQLIQLLYSTEIKVQESKGNSRTYFMARKLCVCRYRESLSTSFEINFDPNH